MPKPCIQYGFPVIASCIVGLATWCNAQEVDHGFNSGHSTLVNRFREQVQPFLTEHCFDCHSADNMESGIRVDNFDGKVAGRSPFIWTNILKQLTEHAMPPEASLQPDEATRAKIVAWIDDAILMAKRRKREKNGSVRRLTVAQYQNTIESLLGIERDFTSLLPPNAVSKDGFLNNEQSMVLSPLLIEAYFDVAERALDLCIVDEESMPTIQNFRLDFGKATNQVPCPDSLILGAGSHLLNNSDFTVTQLRAEKSFDFYPFWMKTRYRFIEGYEGNATVRGWKEYDSIYHSVFACVRGMGGYPKGNAYDVIPEGLLLRPAIPSAELFGVESTYGPRANFKIALRELPDEGQFRVTVNTAKYSDGLLLDRGVATASSDESLVANVASSAEANLLVPEGGVYQVDVTCVPEKREHDVLLTLNDRYFAGELRSNPKEKDKNKKPVEVSFMQVRLGEGPLRLTVHSEASSGLREIRLTRLDDECSDVFDKFERREPKLGVYFGLRRDCGHTFTRVADRRAVSGRDLQEFVFEGDIGNFPNPDVEEGNENYLAGVREIGVRHEFTDGRDMPRLLIRSVEFEGPLYESWPPKTHTDILVDSDRKDDSAAYARQVIERFAARAYRRPVTKDDVEPLMLVWHSAFRQTGNFRESVKDALVVVLTSPQFLFQIETSATPKAEPIDDFELATKLSYFLWNAPPDESLLQLAEAGALRLAVEDQVSRLVSDKRFLQFTSGFAEQWFGLDKLDVVDVDRKKYPKLTRDTKIELRREPAAMLSHLIRNNLPLQEFVQSDFIMANEVVANYYGLAEKTESGFEFQPIEHGDANLGGVLTHAAILAGLSDGRESNPVKRGAWLARKIVAEPPDDPPPNVPELAEDEGHELTLREKLEQHRNQKGCMKCHAGIDPWGLPLEEYDAGGRYRLGQDVEATSTLPDKTEIQNMIELKQYLATDRIDQVAFSVLKHLATYATGRNLSYNEIEYLREAGLELKPDGYRMQDLVRFVVASPLFLEK